jgi:hypothetical protein
VIRVAWILVVAQQMLADVAASDGQMLAVVRLF